MLAQILRQLDLVVVADEDLGIAGGAVRERLLAGAAMHGHGGLVEIALKGEAGVLDEFVVAGSEFGQRLLIEGGEAANGAEVDVNHGIGFGKQARGFRRGRLRSSTTAATAATNSSTQSETMRMRRRALMMDGMR